LRFARRHPGLATIEVIGVAPYAWFERWQHQPWKKRDAEHAALKERLTERLLAGLYRECPTVQGKGRYAEPSTPLTRHFANHPHGEIYGLAHTPARFAARQSRPHTPDRRTEGNENSRFGDQVNDYADLYTSRVSNFGPYSPLRYFRRAAPADAARDMSSQTGRVLVRRLLWLPACARCPA
jgi:hypothetical protein